MSYILDALRKTQEQRNDGDTPSIGDILRVGAQPAPPKSRFGGWFLWLGVGLGICVGIGAGYTLQFKQDKPGLVSPDSHQPTEAEKAAHSAIQRYAEQVRQTTATQASPNPPSTAIPTDEEPVLAYAGGETPLPDFTLDVISYSENPSQRFAMINGTIAKQGDVLSGGYQLLEILNAQVTLKKGQQRLTLKLE